MSMGTEEAIRKTFMELYAREPFDRITVKGLCAAVPVARTTFYAHYGNTDDVRAEVEDILLAGIDRVVQSASGGDLPHMDFVGFLDALFPYIEQNRAWWDCVELSPFEWNGAEGPFNRSYDLLGDGSIQLVNIPGHADGLFAVKVTNDEGKLALLFSDGGYARKSWEEMITSGIAADKQQQKASLAWIRQQSLDPLCVESLANHDPEIAPHVIEL
ncbi:MAG: hypothetical protein Q3963_07815 [Coriobacteriaceae bacterium]|nr:hypothetical protein [Coriobacteriaceae bacterium]